MLPNLCIGCKYEKLHPDTEPCNSCDHDGSKLVPYPKELPEDSNKDLKYDQGKPDMVMLRHIKHALIKIVELMQAGALKYEEGSFATIRNAKRRYDSAIMRHWLEDPEETVEDMQEYIDKLQIDPVMHQAATACNALFRLEIMLRESQNN